MADEQEMIRRLLKPATHLAILYADGGEFDSQRKSQAIFAPDYCGHTWRFFLPIAAMRQFGKVIVNLMG